jgi:hypothetical protein
VNSRSWDTSGFAYGDYVIIAYATPVVGETSIADNTFVGNTVTTVQPAGGCSCGGGASYIK